MARTINMRPEKYYRLRQRYCARRAELSGDLKVKWFWMGTAMRFTHMIKPAGRIQRFRLCPGKHPDFKY